MAWQRKHGKKKSDAWFTGSTTVLRTHIRRYMPYPSTPSASGPCPLDAHRFADTHYEAYAKRCAELGIRPHPRTQREKGLGEGKEYARLVVYLEWLQTRWEQMAEHSRYRSLAPAIKAGLANLLKWYRALDASDAYVVCHSTLSPCGGRNTV